MNIEYAIHDTSFNDLELKNILTELNKFSIHTISILPSSLKTSKSILNSNISIACPIDYPLGINSLETRLSMIQYAAKNGANIVDIMIPHQIVCNRKYEKFRDDIKSSVDLCLSVNIRPRYMFEYRVFNYETLYKLAQILSTYNIFEILPSSGYRLDNIYDNILAGAMIKKKVPKMQVVYNGNIWSESQIDQIFDIKPYGVRVYSIQALTLLYKKYLELKSLG